MKILSISEGTDDRNKIYLKVDKDGGFLPIVDELIGTYSFIDSKDNILWFYTTENAPNGKRLFWKLKMVLLYGTKLFQNLKMQSDQQILLITHS